MSFAGRAASSSGYVGRPRGRETGLTGYAEPIQRSLPTGSSAMETAEHREPYESRGSRTDLGAPGGESPPGDSTDPVEHCAGKPQYRGARMNVIPVTVGLTPAARKASKRRRPCRSSPRMA